MSCSLELEILKAVVLTCSFFLPPIILVVYYIGKFRGARLAFNEMRKAIR